MPDVGATNQGSGGTAKVRARHFYDLPVLVVVAVVIAILINTYLAQVFYIPSASMEPQLHVNDRVVVSKLAYHLHPPRRGDIVVFAAPPGEQRAHSSSANPIGRTFQAIGRTLGVSESKTELIKRVIGLPGDTVQGRDGHVYIGGLLLTEPYLPPSAVTDDFGPVTVPAGELWVMGDNRTNSSDSRVFGPIPVSTVVGRAVWRIWPIDHLSYL